MAEQNTYVKIGRNGEVIERQAYTPADHVQFAGTGWALKGSSAAKKITGQKKIQPEDVSPTSAAMASAAAAAPTTTSSSGGGGKNKS